MDSKMKNKELILGASFSVKGYSEYLLMVFFVILGVIFELFFGDLTDSGISIGSCFLPLAGVVYQSIWVRIECAGFVKASPKRRAVDVEIPAFVSLALFFLLATISFALRLFIGSANGGSMAVGLICTALWYVFMMCYASVTDKAFMPAAIVFLLLYVPVMKYVPQILQKCEEKAGPFFSGSVGWTLVTCYLILFLGAAMTYLLRNLLYKREISRSAVDAYLRKYMRS